MRHARRWLLLLAVGLGLAALAGCAGGGGSAGGLPSVSTSQPAPPPSPAPTPQGVNIAAFHALARLEASAWPRSPLAQTWKTGLVIPSAAELTGGSDPRGFPSGEFREALDNGNFVVTGPWPSGGPAPVVRWGPGTSMKVPVLSAAQTFDALKHNAVGLRCPACQTRPITVTGAQPDTLSVSSNRGEAVIPAWRFTLADPGGPVFQAALPPGSYLAEDSVRGPAENLAPLGPGFVGAVEVSAASPTNPVLLMWLASNPCRTPATWGGLVAEVGDVVVVGGWIHDPAPAAAGCRPAGLGQYVQVRMARPLGSRVILDAATGLPAPYPFHPGVSDG
jgi:hypothetical protein